MVLERENAEGDEIIVNTGDLFVSKLQDKNVLDGIFKTIFTNTIQSFRKI